METVAEEEADMECEDGTLVDGQVTAEPEMLSWDSLIVDLDDAQVLRNPEISW